MDAKGIEDLVLSIHRRNGGTMASLDWNLALMAPELDIDSMDLAEIIAHLEKGFRFNPFDAPEPPRTWADMRDLLLGSDAGASSQS